MNLLGAWDADASWAPNAPATDATAATVTAAATAAATTAATDAAAAATIALAVAMGPNYTRCVIWAIFIPIAFPAL